MLVDSERHFGKLGMTESSVKKKDNKILISGFILRALLYKFSLCLFLFSIVAFIEYETI